MKCPLQIRSSKEAQGLLEVQFEKRWKSGHAKPQTPDTTSFSFESVVFRLLNHQFEGRTIRFLPPLVGTLRKVARQAKRVLR